MATTSAVGNGPVEFTDDKGDQVSIPLGALRFKDGVLTIPVDPTTGRYPTWPPYGNYTAGTKTLIANLLNDLASEQLIVPAPVASPKPALVIQAADPGAPGNNISVGIKVTSQPDPTQTKFDVTVTATESYPGLTVATIEKLLGSNTAPPVTLRLVHVIHASITSDPKGVPDPIVSNYPLTGPSGASTKASVDVKDSNAKVVFTLEAKKDGIDGAKTTVTISNVDSTKLTFDLQAVWSKSAAGATIGTVQQLIHDNLGYEVTVSPPPSGVFSVPRDTGSAPIQLSGGADGPPASAALATVFAG